MKGQIGMLILTDNALEHIRARGQVIFLELPIVIQGDITIRERPSVRWGLPRDQHNYQLEVVQGIEIYVPHDLPGIPLTITVSHFLWMKWLAVEGWALA